MLERRFTIHAPIEKVFDVITNLEAYPEFIQGTNHVEVRQLSATELEAEFTVNVIKKIKYRLRFHKQAPEHFTWTFINGDLMKENRGSWELKKLDPNSTEAIYRIDIRFGMMVPKAIVDKLTETQLPSLLEAFKNRCEQP